jgi:nitrogen fixation/metabolism regulation signal transduction histidine kinase
VSSERTFLHDISSPLTTAQLNVENVVSILEERKIEDIQQCLKMLTSCMNQLKRASTMISNRRESLIKEEGIS